MAKYAVKCTHAQHAEYFFYEWEFGTNFNNILDIICFVEGEQDHREKGTANSQHQKREIIMENVENMSNEKGSL